MASFMAVSTTATSSTILPLSKLTGPNARSNSSSSISTIHSRMQPVLRSSFLAKPKGLSTSSISDASAKRRFTGRIVSKYLGNAAGNGSPQGTFSSNGGSTASTQSAPHGTVTPATAGAISILVAIGLPLLAGTFISSFNKPSSDWYRSLNKPSWNPPDALFGGVWSVLYAAMGYSAWLVWRQGGLDQQSGPLTIYAVQLVLNLLWPILCFGAKSLFWSLIDIVALCFAVNSTIKAFHPVDEFAAQLLWPYFGWVLFATVLNFTLWRVNRRNGHSPPGTTAGTRVYST